MEYIFCVLFVPLGVIGLTLALQLLKKLKPIAKLSPILIQAIIGLIYGGLAIASTHSGIEVAGAIVNCRDAWILVSGLVFGPIAGITAGVVGGFERLMVGLFADVGAYSVWACSIAALLSGLVGGLIYYLYNRKQKLVCPFVGLGAALLIEVIHMALIVVFKLDDASNAWNDVVLNIAGPMILGTSLATFVGVFFSNMLSNKLSSDGSKCSCH